MAVPMLWKLAHYKGVYPTNPISIWPNVQLTQCQLTQCSTVGMVGKWEWRGSYLVVTGIISTLGTGLGVLQNSAHSLFWLPGLKVTAGPLMHIIPISFPLYFRVVPNCVMKAKNVKTRVFIADQIDDCKDLSGIYYLLPFQKVSLVFGSCSTLVTFFQTRGLKYKIDQMIFRFNKNNVY